VVVVATEIRSAADRGSLLRAAIDAGAAGAHIGGGCLVSEVAPVAAELLAAGLAVPSMALPLADRAPGAGKRLPRLGAPDQDEREAALALASAGLAAGAAVGIGRALVDFGPVALPVPRAEVARSFRRREIDDDEPGARSLEAAVSARKASATALLDACRFALEQLCREAETRGVRLLLPVAGTPWGMPSPREAEWLLAAFAGAPLATAWDPGQLSVLRALGLPLSDTRLRALAAQAGAALENDAVGMDAGYLPGLGERDESLPARAELGPDAPVIVLGAAGARATASDAEIAEAIRRVTATYA
jgi:hypothetical protein